MNKRKAFDADALTSSIDDLKKLLTFLLEAKDNSQAWKWVVLALNSALNGFAAIAIMGDSDLNLAKLPVKIKRKGQQDIEVNNVFELRKLRLAGQLSFEDYYVIEPREILKRCQNPKHVDGEPLKLRLEQRESIKYLQKDLRNWFNHPKPGVGAAIMTPGLPRLCKDVLEVIQVLVEKGISNHRWEKEHQKQEVVGLCSVGLSIVGEMIRLQDIEKEVPRSNNVS